MMPVSILHVDEIDPLGIVRQQRMSVQISGKNLDQISARLVVIQLSEVRILPRLFIAFDDKRAGRPVELVGMGGKDASRVFAERQRQAVKELLRAIPDVLVLTDIQ